MSFDIHFQPCRFDGTTEERVNPFTRQTQQVPRNAPLSADEVAAVRDTLVRAGAAAPDRLGCQLVRLADGGGAEVSTNDLEHGCMFSVRGAGVTPMLARLLFDILTAGRWMLIDEDVAVAAKADDVKSLPPQFKLGEVVLVRSAEELMTLLSAGFEAWKKYRDGVVGGPPR